MGRKDTMPPTKTPQRPKDEHGAATALALCAKNLEEIRRWYRGATYAGHDAGHVVMSELILGHVATAMQMGIEGKEWAPPQHSP